MMSWHPLSSFDRWYSLVLAETATTLMGLFSEEEGSTNKLSCHILHIHISFFFQFQLDCDFMNFKLSISTDVPQFRMLFIYKCVYVVWMCTYCAMFYCHHSVLVLILIYQNQFETNEKLFSYSFVAKKNQQLLYIVLKNIQCKDLSEKPIRCHFRIA